ncbi:hypothetical protein EVG20_g7950 [Dentipellis fragilis]|uniref:Ubiquitin-like domain-containing protein n=1 Tax=Dentipellis fragilis TaxID=205917 RepID=A0A4Y9YAE6_9AGAM|nr:hypothetical protein EVG20_g7950 [Dentipellis fragilis]
MAEQTIPRATLRYEFGSDPEAEGQIYIDELPGTWDDLIKLLCKEENKIADNAEIFFRGACKTLSVLNRGSIFNNEKVWIFEEEDIIRSDFNPPPVTKEGKIGLMWRFYDQDCQETYMELDLEETWGSAQQKYADQINVPVSELDFYYAAVIMPEHFALEDNDPQHGDIIMVFHRYAGQGRNDAECYGRGRRRRA